MTRQRCQLIAYNVLNPVINKYNNQPRPTTKVGLQKVLYNDKKPIDTKIRGIGVVAPLQGVCPPPLVFFSFPVY